jgi:hypothetical protein
MCLSMGMTTMIHSVTALWFVIDYPTYSITSWAKLMHVLLGYAPVTIKQALLALCRKHAQQWRVG